ncbi:hypothetical protein [Sandaracinus amylolyticus]|uniref:hypothetical protein n=1 Tax=Sandaracinus amylolyticus TaxID=927083 RepID=UPI001F452A02|nr:hypothetical protein [Sandaracinus amylolyticus]UJR85359.1 Hypothetical protein I5071_74390 [Sandaracinus amylolyticus]
MHGSRFDTRTLGWMVLGGALSLLGCGDDDDGTTEVDASTPIDAWTAPVDAPMVDAGGETCTPFPGDYTPRVSMSSTDEWPPCVSDVGTYARIEPTISTIARVEAYDTIFAPSGLLVGDPSASAFTDARTVYETSEGLGSRVIRRTDEHVTAPDPNDCRMGSVIAAAPEYCVGPTQLAPIVREGFAAGMTGGAGEPLRVHAARIDAALTWFLYVSPYKESLTCTSTARDCDSAWAYYTGGVEERSGGLGMARLVRGLDEETHDRIWDALLAVRCWRDLDPEPVSSERLDLRDRARAQLDRAMDRGMALVIADRLRRMEASTGDEQLAHFAWARVILGSLAQRTIPSPDPGGTDIVVPARASLADRMLRARSADLADLVASEIDGASAPGDVDVDAIVEMLESAFPCA